MKVLLISVYKNDVSFESEFIFQKEEKFKGIFLCLKIQITSLRNNELKIMTKPTFSDSTLQKAADNITHYIKDEIKQCLNSE